ncbi:hypothetical protein EGW08_009408, partial [Elysia chlorotica]
LSKKSSKLGLEPKTFNAVNVTRTGRKGGWGSNPATALNTRTPTTPGPKFKVATGGRGVGRQHGRPSFKITSSTSKKRKFPEKRGVSYARSRSLQQKNKALAAAGRYKYQDGNSGNVFLKHLDFRPIQMDQENSDGMHSWDGREDPLYGSADVNYTGWLHSNDSDASSFTSDIDVDLSSVELDAFENEESFGVPPVDGGAGASVAAGPGGESHKDAAPEISGDAQAAADMVSGSPPVDAKVSAASQLPASKNTFCSLQEVLLPCTGRSEGGDSDKSPSPEEQVSAGVERALSWREIGTRDAHEDELLDRELQQTMRHCEGKGHFTLASPRCRARASGLKCDTPHVGRASSEKTPRGSCNGSNEDSQTQIAGKNKGSASQMSSNSGSASASANLNDALLKLDAVSRERVQKEFDQRLGKYISMLCGDTAETAAFRRLQDRILRQKNRANLPHAWTGLASKVSRKFRPNASTEPTEPEAAKPHPEAAAVSADDEVAANQQCVQQNFSFNKKEEPRVSASETCGAHVSRRPHSSPAKDMDLSVPIRRAPTPSLRFLLNYAVSSHQRQMEERKQLMSEEPRAAAARQRRAVGDIASPPHDKPRVGGHDAQGVCAKPPAWRANPNTDRTVQTDAAECACAQRANPRTPSVSNGMFPAAPTSPSCAGIPNFPMFGAANTAQGKVRPAQTEPAWSPQTGGYPSPPPSAFTFVPSWRNSSTGSLSDGITHVARRSPPLLDVMRVSSLRDARGPPGRMTQLISSPRCREDAGRHVTSSSVELDLEKYNAVMNRCRALLGETQLDEDDSSSWTHSSYAGLGAAASAPAHVEAHDYSPPLASHPGAYKDEAHREGDACRRSILPIPGPRAGASDAAAHARRSLRPCSVQVPRNPRPGASFMPVKRSSSNPHYVGVINFGSVEAIKRIVDPLTGQGKPKVTFDIDSDKSVTSAASSGSEKKRCGQEDASPLSVAVKNVLSKAVPSSSGDRKNRGVAEAAAGRAGQKLRLKPAGTNVRLVSDLGQITPMRSRQDRAATSGCMSRQPIRLNHYYNLGLDRKPKSSAAPAPRPASQSSWKTVDTDAALQTTPDLAAVTREGKSGLAHKKKKRPRKKSSEAGLSEGSPHRSKKSSKKQSKKKARKAKSATAAGDDTGDAQAQRSAASLKNAAKDAFEADEATEPKTCVQAVRSSDSTTAVAVAEDNKTSRAASPAAAKKSKDASPCSGANVVQTSPACQALDAAERAPAVVHKDVLSERSLRTCGSCESTACREDVASKSPKTRAALRRQHSTTGGGIKTVVACVSGDGIPLVKHQPGAGGAHQHPKVPGGVKVLGRPSAASAKRHGHHVVRLAGRAPGLVAHCHAEAAAGAKQLGLDSGGDVEATQPADDLERYRQAFASYRETH